MAEQNKKEEVKKENAKAKDEKEKKDKKDIVESEDEDTDDGDLILENERESVPLNRNNAKFFHSKGGLISLELTNADGEKETFERVIIMRAFPVTNPDEFLSVREPDSKKMGRGKEIGMIRYMTDFDEETGRLFLEELDRRYFSPQITKIMSIKDKFGYLYWDTETTAGHITFVLTNPFSNIRMLEDGRIIVNDIDGNIFEIPDPQKLDSASYKKIEMYL